MSARLYRGLFAAVTWLALAVQVALAVGGKGGWDVAASIVRLFSFFTILTNVLVALAFTGPLLRDHRRLARWSASEGVRASVAMYITVVGVIYHLLLAPYWNPTGWLLIVNVVLHTVTPTAFVLDWLLFTPKGRLRWIDAAKWLGFPLVYGAWTLVHGLATGWWPYGFVDPGQIGWGGLGVSLMAFAAFFYALGLLIVAMDRALSRRARRDSAPSAL
jgi:hypothetical protein